MTDLQTFADFAEEVAAAGAAAALRWSEGDWDIQNKSQVGSFDPVTRADRDAELAMRALIEARWTDHGIEGEEFGRKTATSPYCWSLDPIDGTRSFISGLPSWTVLVALLQGGRPILGVIDAPRLGERFVGYGQVGQLVTPAGRSKLSTSQCGSLSAARLATTDPYLFSDGEREAFEGLRQRARLTRYGLDGYAYAKLAMGGLDLVVESGLAPHDLNALVPIVTAAGGAVSNWSGEADLSQGSIVAAASESLLHEAVKLLN